MEKQERLPLICGRGCIDCCNCGLCRNAERLLPRGLLLHNSSIAGFSNVHDYVVHLKSARLSDQHMKRRLCNGQFEAMHLQSIEKSLKDPCRKEKRKLYATDMNSQSDPEVKLRPRCHSNLKRDDSVMKLLNKHEMQAETGYCISVLNTKHPLKQGIVNTDAMESSLVTFIMEEEESGCRTKNFGDIHAATQTSKILNMDEDAILNCNSSRSTMARRGNQSKSSYNISVMHAGENSNFEKSNPLLMKTLNYLPLSPMKIEKEDLFLKSCKMILTKIGDSEATTCMVPSRVECRKSYDVLLQSELKNNNDGTTESFPFSNHLRAEQDISPSVVMQKKTIEPVFDHVVSIDSSDDEDRESSSGVKVHQMSTSNKTQDMEIFQKQLDAKVREPFNNEELENIWKVATCRKPIYKARETRQGTCLFPTREQGLSYLDHHPDLAQMIISNDDPKEKLALLRGFFFWLEHASAPGAFKPWIIQNSWQRTNDDCIEVNDGPDSGVFCNLK